MADVASRLSALHWTAIERSLWEWGYARTPALLTPEECASSRRCASTPTLPLAALANQFEAALDTATLHSTDLAALLAICHRRGQTKPTPLLLHYEAGGYNCLHQDVYGDVVFSLQLTCLLSRSGVDDEGGDFLLVEQRPRAQSRGEAIALEQGEIVIFPTRYRPVHGARGWYRAAMRHGVSRVIRGRRYRLGVIFHDAR
jgi:hypothetical protein